MGWEWVLWVPLVPWVGSGCWVGAMSWVGALCGFWVLGGCHGLGLGAGQMPWAGWVPWVGWQQRAGTRCVPGAGARVRSHAGWGGWVWAPAGGPRLGARDRPHPRPQLGEWPHPPSWPPSGGDPRVPPSPVCGHGGSLGAPWQGSRGCQVLRPWVGWGPWLQVQGHQFMVGLWFRDGSVAVWGLRGSWGVSVVGSVVTSSSGGGLAVCPR